MNTAGIRVVLYYQVTIFIYFRLYVRIGQSAGAHICLSLLIDAQQRESNDLLTNSSIENDYPISLADIKLFIGISGFFPCLFNFHFG